MVCPQTRQDLSCTYLAHHELESVSIICLLLLSCPQLCVKMMEYLHEPNVVINAWEGLPREGVQGGDLWPVKLLSQHQHDLQLITTLKLVITAIVIPCHAWYK